MQEWSLTITCCSVYLPEVILIDKPCAFNNDYTLSDISIKSWASGLVMHCLPMSHKKDARLKWVNEVNISKMSFQ